VRHKLEINESLSVPALRASRDLGDNHSTRQRTLLLNIGPSGLRISEHTMDHESIRSFCLSLPHVTEDIQWEKDLLFRIGNKMFTVLALDDSTGHVMSFKCTPEVFAELTERPGIVPAPYVARYHWVALERFDALKGTELKSLIKDSYDMVLAKLPNKIRAHLQAEG